MTFLISFCIVAALVAIVFLGFGLFPFIVVNLLGLYLSIQMSLNPLLTLLIGIVSLASVLCALTPLRRQLISGPFFGLFKKMLPPLSPTERDAIDAGTVWWDGELFTGKPNWNSLISVEKPKLSQKEQDFLDGPVNELCRMADAWKINHDWNVIPEEIVEFIRRNGFISMIIPEEYGGMEFSAVAQSEVLIKLANTGAGISYLVAVPNSLGPGELLIKYGTEEQKQHYLPRLASGDDIPCFALTAPLAGSDATSIPDTGVVCKGTWQGEEVIGMRLNFSKRYITLAPVATLVGLAFKLSDPDHLIGDVDDYGITCALLPRETEGLKIDTRHFPIGDTFLNSPIQGKDVFVPLDFIIGGKEMAGKGWTMLVNCLSIGRCITLPTLSAGYTKRALMGTSAYSCLRKQFGLPLKDFEGIQKPLARIAGLSYICNATRLHTIQSLEFGEKPSVTSAILKYHCTEMARQCLSDAMDIHGGKAIMKGPKNYIASGYESIPVAITVEGANILTRNLMIFGQGAIRSHPYVLSEMLLAEKEASDEVIEEFDDVLFKHIAFSCRNAVRAFVLGLTGSRLARSPGSDSLSRYYQHLDRFSAAFALIADLSMLSLQSKLKFMEMISARLGDLLSDLFMASMVIKHYENDGCPEEDWPVVQWSLDYLLYDFQQKWFEITDNFPNKAVAVLLNLLAFPLGRHFKAPADQLEKELVKVVTTDNAARDRLISGLYMEQGNNNPLAHVNTVFLESLSVQELHQKLRKAVKERKIPKLQSHALIEAANTAGLLSSEEYEQLMNFEDRLMSIINVDDFAEDDLIRKAVGS